MARPEAIRIGPFVGGLNTSGDASSIQDTDVVICENFDVGIDGSLVNRQPITLIGKAWPYGPPIFLGYYTDEDGRSMPVVSDQKLNVGYYLNNEWVRIISNRPIVAMAQYKDKAWFVSPPGSTFEGMSWGGPGTTAANVVGMPKGTSIAVNKERLWIGTGGRDSSLSGSILYYSAPGEPNKWPDSSPAGGGYLNVSDGDGQTIVKVVVYFTDILIFKTNSTYRFSFSTDPGLGVLNRQSATIGAADPGCVVGYESDLYVMHKEHVYLLSNYNFSRVNIKVPLIERSVTAAERPNILSVWADSLFVYAGAVTYVYNLRTKTWATWKTSVMTLIGEVLEVPTGTSSERIAYIIDNGKNATRIGKISTLTTSTESETMECVVRTKIYDYQSSHTFKKLAHWGADMLTRSKVTAKAVVVVNTIANTWDEVAQHSWEDLGTWANLTDKGSEVTDPVEIGGLTRERKYVRFLRALRFRQIYFELRFETKGDLATSPVKLFTITTFVGSKQIAPHKVN